MNDHHIPSRNGNGGWRAAALTAVGTVLFAIVGWIATDATNARTKMADDIAGQAQRIAVLEESNRNVRESQARIEKLLEDIRREMQERRR
jgi:hypothetical protein